ncbi:unnamed protein product [Sphenostylis stenocarpa]|uniref:Uncharacterized protein n=1 Tax=Sphenostylis stenocarpa TaxID=92480 RepID=A0AA86SJW3_9FABA|nr:unnamed protein product [Sphenostylis stenocarpa]
MRPVTGNRKVARFPGNDLPFVCKNAERRPRPPIQLPCLPALTIAAYRYRWKVACFSSPRRLPTHVIREEKAASGSSLSRATSRRLLSEGLRRIKSKKMDEQRFELDPNNG